MKKTLVMAGAALALGASLAAAQPGINLAWNDCGLNGQVNATFACNTNTGLNTMVASFVPPTGINEFLGIASQVDITFGGSTVPDWWAHGSGQCRGTTGLSVNFDFTGGPFSCVDFYIGSAAGGFAYDVGYGQPNRARFRIQAAVPFDNRGALDPSMEYYAFKANALRSKTTGTGFCAGCSEPACIVLNEIQLFQPPEAANDPAITTPKDSNFITWQSTPVQTPPCPLSTPTSKSSWGQVKSLYR